MLRSCPNRSKARILGHTAGLLLILIVILVLAFPQFPPDQALLAGDPGEVLENSIIHSGTTGLQAPAAAPHGSAKALPAGQLIWQELPCPLHYRNIEPRQASMNRWVNPKQIRSPKFEPLSQPLSIRKFISELHSVKLVG